MKSVCARRERGAALILFATILVLGVAWFTVGALGKAAPTTAEREIKTGLALQAAKQALLAYVAQYAARSNTVEPGQMPCPESLTSIGGGNEGQASSSCGNSPTVGRLPWRTLGIDQLPDGYGEPLWYALSGGFRSAPINYGTLGQLSYNGTTNAVAVIIAPGKPINTLSDSGTPTAGCSKVNQQVNTRNTASLVAANFLECGNATGTAYANPGTSQWTNDRAIAITATEWADAIAPAVNDRLQRQVAAVLGDWHQVEFAATGKSWAATHGMAYLPFASTWGDPTTNDYCGNQGAYEGLAPVDSGCENNRWTGNASTGPGGLATVGGCTNVTPAPPAVPYRRCRFVRANATTPLTAQITLTASDVARAFRSTISVADLVVTGGGTTTMAMALSGGNSDATAIIDVTWPLSLAVLAVVEVQIPHLQAAAILTDSRFTWFWNNQWHRYTYYAIAPGAAAPATSACTPGTNCLTASGLPSSTGNTNDKRLVLVLSGRPLSGKTQPSNDRLDYFESDNATAGDESFASGTVSTAFNDRVAACPFKYVPASGSPLILCN